jgi:hypothetical protein
VAFYQSLKQHLRGLKIPIKGVFVSDWDMLKSKIVSESTIAGIDLYHNIQTENPVLKSNTIQ